MSRPPRFFISTEQVVPPQIIISGDDVRHIVNVLRMNSGDELVLCDGKGTDYTVKIVGASKNEVRTEIVSQTSRDINSSRIILGQGLPKSDKMDFIVQKATELGVSQIVPLVMERTIVKIKDEEKRVSRWQKIAREAAMQSNRADIPEVVGISSFKNFLRTPHSALRTLLLLPWEEGTESIKNVLRRNPDAENIVVLIGPEGGISAAEAEAAKGMGFHPVSLGPNILRTETAAIAAIAMIGYEFH